jgi:hypothetical protein
MSRVASVPRSEKLEAGEEPALTQTPGGRRLEGRVAKLLNERELVINIGQRDGVDFGMRFAVLAATPLPVHDPETGELLGQLDREKVKVQVVEVLDRMSICRTFETHVLGEDGELSELFESPIVIAETLHGLRDAFPTPLAYEESFVKIGDRVKLVAA